MTAPAQHMVALGQANRVRLARADLHREIAALSRPEGCGRVADLLKEPPQEIAKLAIFDLLQWPKHVGQSQARAILRMHGSIGERRQIQQLSARQRGALAEHLRGANLGWDGRKAGRGPSPVDPQRPDELELPAGRCRERLDVERERVADRRLRPRSTATCC